MSARTWEAPRAEWTKLRTVPGTHWLLLGVVALTVALSATAAATTTCPDTGCGRDPARVALTGIAFGQALVVMLAVLTIGGEYGTGMIRVTFAAMPRRICVLAAKAAVTSGLVLVAGTVAVLGSVLVGRLVLPGNGFTAANGFEALSLANGSVMRAAAGSVGYLVLIGLLSLGVATAVREAAASIGIVLGLLYLFPVVAAVVADPDWHRYLERVGPMTAGLAIQATVAPDRQPIGPWAGLGVLAVWAAGALLIGALVLRTRDA